MHENICGFYETNGDVVSINHFNRLSYLRLDYDFDQIKYFYY